MSVKRSHIEIDPDYEDVSEVQNKRRRVLEEGAKKATKKRIEAIVDKQFSMEVSNKETELLAISERLELAKSMMDRLRACIVANFFGNAGQQKTQRSSDHAPMIHPTVRKYIGKAPRGTPLLASADIKKEVPSGSQDELQSERIGQITTKSKPVPHQPARNESETRTGRFKVKKRVIVGNVSKSIPADQRDENDQATHKWMVYVRGPKESARINDYVKKVWFFLHPSYRPNDLVEVSEPPFHLTRRGWGEFPVRVQLHFRDHRNKRLDIIHNLKLDRTYTGLQTLGSETVVDIEIEKEVKPTGRLSCTQAIKQEPIDDQMQWQDSTLPHRVKTEPNDDQEYGVMTTQTTNGDANALSFSGKLSSVDSESVEKSPMLANMLICSTAGQAKVSPGQAIVASNLIGTQPLTLIPVGTPIPQSPGLLRIAPMTPTKDGLKIAHVTPTKDGVANVVISSPVTNVTVPSPSRNVVLKGFGSITTPMLVDSQKNIAVTQVKMANSPNSVLTVSPVKSLNSGSVNFAVPQQLLLAGNQANKGNQSGIQTAGQQVKINPQSPNSGLIFLKCTDTQGKTFLIPQQVCTSMQVSGIKNSTALTGQSKASPKGSQLLTLAKSLPSTVTTAFVTNSPNKSAQANMKATGLPDSSAQLKSLSQNGPVLFVKPENNTSTRKGTSLIPSKSAMISQTVNPVKTSPASNIQLVRAANPNVNSVNVPPGGKHMVALSNQSLLRGQLKVTSQGLINLQSQNNKVSQVISGEQAVLINGGVGKQSPSNAPRQPFILVPASVNNKMTVGQGKGKSLLSNFSSGQSNGNVIVLNQSSAIQGTNSSVGRLVFSSSSINKSQTAMSTAVSCGISPHKVTSATQSKQAKLSANHIVIVPVTSQQTVAMTTKCSTTAISVVSGTNVLKANSMISAKCVNTDTSSTSGNITTAEAKSHDNNSKSVLILLQNDKSNGVATTKETSLVNENGQGQKSRSILSLLNLGQRSASPTVAMATGSESMTSVTISSHDNKQKRVVLVKEPERNPDSIIMGKEKKIINLEPKKKKPPRVEAVPEVILPLCCEDFADLRSLVRTAVERHPVVSDAHSHQLHPYCARSREEWLSWNLGKRRASEWQRASTVRRYILSHLKGSLEFHGEKIWTVKQLLVWCRLHAYSPHYLERPLHPTSIDLQAETSLGSGKQHKTFSSLSNNDVIVQDMTSLQQEVMSSALDISDDELDIESTETKKPTYKLEVIEEPGCSSDAELLPLAVGSPFAERVAQQIGIKLPATEVIPGYHGHISQGMLYRSMELFMEELLRESFALQVNMGRYPDALGVTDVFTALNNLPIADFLTNKFLGVPDSQSISFKDR